MTMSCFSVFDLLITLAGVFQTELTTSLYALLDARRGRAAAPSEAGAAAAPAPPDSPPLPIFPRPQPHTSDRHPRSISVAKKTSAADATCFSVLPCGRASTFGFARAMPERATRAKPAVEKSLEERVGVVVAGAFLSVGFFWWERKRRKRLEKEGGTTATTTTAATDSKR